MSASKRIDFIDCAKGFAIILVIIGHTVREGGLLSSILRAVIFSFHMPLFFILSSYTFRLSKDSSEFIRKTKKAAVHLLVPVLILFIINICYSLYINSSLLFDLHFWRGKVFSVLFSSGVETSFGNFVVPALGMPWFFVALFVGRSLYDYLHMKLNGSNYLLGVCILLSLIGIVLGYTNWLPFSLDVVLAIMPLFYYGDNMKKENYNQSIIISFVCWAVLFLLTSPGFSTWTYLELSIRRYPLYPICFIAAIYGTLFICNISKKITGLGVVTSPLLFIGKNSLYLFVVHCVDYLPCILRLWKVTGNELINAIFRICVDIVIFLFVISIKYIISKVSVKTKNI